MHLPGVATESVKAEQGGVQATPGQEIPGQLDLALRPEAASQPVPEELLRIGYDARRVQEQIDQLRNIPEFAEDDDAVYLGLGWGMLARRDRDAILQPPKPDLMPARAVLHRAHDRAGDREPEPG
jgi:hypothetical protein